MPRESLDFVRFLYSYEDKLQQLLLWKRGWGGLFFFILAAATDLCCDESTARCCHATSVCSA